MTIEQVSQPGGPRQVIERAGFFLCIQRRKNMKLHGIKALHFLFVFMIVFVMTVSCLGMVNGTAYAQDGTTDSSVAPAEGQTTEVNPYYSEQQVQVNGLELTKSIINGPSQPIAGYEVERTPVEIFPATAKTLANVPAYNWVFGCSAVSGSMIAGYLTAQVHQYVHWPYQQRHDADEQLGLG
jgi:hypothetical protein